MVIVFGISLHSNDKKKSMFSLRRLIVNYLRELADKIDTGTSEITEDEAMDILKVVAHESLSKAQASSYLNLSQQQFDALIRQNQIPKGKKVVGFKEKRWWKDELDVCLYKLKKNKKSFGKLIFNV